MFFDPTIILLLPGIIIALWASINVNSTFDKYNKVISASGLTGAQVAERVLHHHGVYNVRIERVAGNLSDHYDPRANVIRLSDSTYASTSIAAAGVAAHEAGLGTVIMGIFDEDKVAQLINMPNEREMVALIALGYPNEEPMAPKRKTVDDLLTIME